MCGINVLLSQKENITERLTVMNSVIRHRGPDDNGIWQDEKRSLGFGHTRLSIIDLSKHGRQPMSYNGHNLVITFNGEIYNYPDLKKDLIKKGYTFQSNSDTEVILASYMEWGPKCIEKFNGMWAFALYDRKKNYLFCSRDRVGIKPFYYYLGNGEILISSEIKGIIAAGIRAEVDAEGLSEYFTFQNIITERTLFKNIKMLKPGHNLLVDLDSRSIKIELYWDMEYFPIEEKEDDLAEELYEIFKLSMKRHLISDVEIGATISGGMDSSAIVAIASKHFQMLNTFTGYFNTNKIDLEDRCVSEKDDARLMANYFKTQHHEREITPQDLIDTLPGIVWHLEDPKVGMCYTFYTISQLVGSFVTVNLSGTGGDEIFAGYPWRYSLIENLDNQNKFNNTYYNWWSRLIKDNQKKKFFNDLILNQIDINHCRSAFEDTIQPANGFSNINKALYFDMKTFLHGFLMVEDKMGMAFSIETRFPFLDKEMLKFLGKVPDSLKYKNGVSKHILKKAFKNLLPEEIIHKRKQGFTPPDRTWYKRELTNYIQQLLLSKKSCIGEFINTKIINDILERHNKGDDERLIIWSMLFFEGWCRTFLKNDPLPMPRMF